MKILSNKKYNELILKSCKGMFGAVTDDMLLKDNYSLNEENKQLKEAINKAIEILKLCNSQCARETIDILKEVSE